VEAGSGARLPLRCLDIDNDDIQTERAEVDIDTADIKLSSVLYPVTDLAAAVAFYRDGLGLPTKFVDGDRYAALDAGGATFALAAGTERVSEGPVASFKVADLPAALERIRLAGGAIVAEPVDGPHEVRAVVADADGNQFVVYAPR
jgi:predicted enzyme related to lactoylglutathione lyase